MSGCGYTRASEPAAGSVRLTPDRVLGAAQGPLFRVSPAMPSSAGGQVGGGVRPHVTHTRDIHRFDIST